MTGVEEVFASGGAVGRDLARVDWDGTPIGPPEMWPSSLVSVVRVMLSSRFSMWMGWGPELTFFCNDAYRRDTLSRKYPWALGRPAREVWAEIWPDIGPRVERVLAGDATWDEALMLILERSGYREETYHTFSYSPLWDDDGAVAGLICVVSEETERVLGARRMATVRDVTTHITALHSEDEVLAAAAAQLSNDLRSLPFSLIYLLDTEPAGGDGNGAGEASDVLAVLGAAAGVPAGHPVAPPVLNLADPSSPWPVLEVLEGRTVLVEDLPARFRDVPAGPWPEPPGQALVVPFRRQGAARPLGFLVAGLNRYRRVDAEVRGFVELLADQIATALTGARAYQEERERAERLVELDRAKTEFFTNVSHEFRTPLTLLLGPAEDALADAEHPIDDVQRGRLEIIQRNGERLLKLVNTLLDFSRLEEGTLDARFEPVDLATYTAELAASFSAAVRRAGLELTVDCPPLSRAVHVDREMWAKIVLNLLSNAVKFTFSGGITVRLRERAGDAVLEVSDTGVGIPEEAQGRLFQRFTRVPGAASRSFEGSGIGLALVADLAQAHGGRVDVQSTPGAGSTFTVAVPLGSRHLAADHVVEGVVAARESPLPAGQDVARSARGFLAEALRWTPSGAPSPGGTGAGSGTEGGRGDAARAPAADGAVERAGDGRRPRVLVADDNSDMREYVAGLLGSRYEVLFAADGEQALELAREQLPDLVLSDVMMPRLDGFGLVRALREDPVTALTPVVLLSARAGEESTIEGLDAGADDYLVKPFSARELIARVRANLELERSRRSRRELERSQALLDQAERLARIGSWELDVSSGAITASTELARQLDVPVEELAREGSFERVLLERLHPADRNRVRQLMRLAARTGEPIDEDQRHVLPNGEVRTYHAMAEAERDTGGRIVRLRGSYQDVTGQREAELALSAVAAAAEAAAREHKIASELQRGLLPETASEAEALRLATYYRAGVEGTQVGGDWYDVVELGARRTALVLGDVMGRGVKAAAVMGQLRSAVRAYARLDLPPAEILEHLDGVVRELSDDQIVTCVYAVFDPYDRVLHYANAGHLPPLLRSAGGGVRQLHGADSAPLGAVEGPLTEHSVQLEPGDLLALYTDGLVEHRDSDIEIGLKALAEQLRGLPAPLRTDAPDQLVATLLPEGPDDDVAVLLAEVTPALVDGMVTVPVRDDLSAVHETRSAATAVLEEWGVEGMLREQAVLLLSELTTNALLHGRPPVEVRISRGARHLTLEVRDGATTVPRRVRPGADDEHGRGLLLVSLLAQRWGTRPTPEGKAVWCTLALEGAPVPGG